MSCLFDVFLSHNSQDKLVIREIARLLREQGLRPWMDEEQLIPGERWQDALARGVRDSATCAMFIGPNNLGNWQEEELDLVRNRAATSREYRLTPVLLPGLTDPFDTSLIPPFLNSRTWVDLRHGVSDPRAMHLLVCSINGPSRMSAGLTPESSAKSSRSLAEKRTDFLTETEWEYAARGGTTTEYSFGDDESKLGDYAWFADNAGRETHPVGQKKPNPFGLYDMHGNVFEWVEDHWHENYEGAPTDGSAWLTDDDNAPRVLRGGSWYLNSDLRSASRDTYFPDYRYLNIGFRVVVGAQTQPEK